MTEPHGAPARGTSVAVIVPATDGPVTLGACVSALEAAMRPGDELVVVALPACSGPAAARNAGAAGTTNPILVFVDADVTIAPDALERLRARFDERADLDAVFGSYDDAPAHDGTVSSFRNLLHHHVHQSSPGPATTFWAGIGAIRRSTFESVGRFDEERYGRSCIEDVELGMRIASAGGRIELDPAVQGTHHKRWTLRGMLWTDLVHRGMPWASLLLERREAPLALNLAWRHRLSAAASVTILGAVLRRRSCSALVATGVVVCANRRFYALLWLRRGSVEAASGVILHVLHHLAGVTALAVVLVRRVVLGRSGGRAATGDVHPPAAAADAVVVERRRVAAGPQTPRVIGLAALAQRPPVAPPVTIAPAVAEAPKSR